MGKGSKQTEQVVRQTNLPDYAQPYVERLMERAEGLSLTDYTPYEGQRIADTSAATLGARGMTRDVAGSGIAGLPQAMGVVGQTLGATGDLFGQGGPYQFGAARQFVDPGVAERYMSPYVRNVLDVQKAQAQRTFDEQGGQRAAQAVRAGAFGGGRYGVMEGVAQRGLADRMADIEASGLQNAFTQAQQMFGADRAAQMQTAARQAAEDRAALGQRANLLQLAGQQAGQLVNLGQAQRATDIQNAQLMERLGAAEEAEQQRSLDMGYEDFIRQQAYPEQQLQLLSSVLRGVPMEPSVTQTAYAPYSPLREALGAGLTGLSLYKGLMG